MKTIRAAIPVLLELLGLFASPRAAAAGGRPESLRVGDGVVAYAVTGQVNNFAPNKSIQVGYLHWIAGLSDLFSSSTVQNESTAFFTFYTDTTTLSKKTNGPWTLVEREGTMTIYVNSSPHANFTDLNSFRDGVPVLVLSLHQQVMVDTVGSTFQVVIMTNVQSSGHFQRGSVTYELGRQGDRFRTTYVGRTPSTTPPDGHFSGYAVAVGGRDERENDK
jgi:hypothetical protein